MAPVWALLLGAAVVIPYGRSVQAQAGQPGQWVTLPYAMPINPVHVALLHDGNVLIVSGSGNLATETTFRAALWNRQAGAITTQTLDWDMFCNGMVMLPDGRPFVVGGNLRYDPFYGERRSAAYDPVTGTFSDLSMMAHGRWYPTVTMLGDGRVMAFSGTRETGGTNTSVEIYTPGVGWSPEYPSGGWTPPLYPRMHLVPDGRVFYSGSGVGSRFFDPTTNTWSGIVATSSASRNYGTSVLLPLSPHDGYRARVLTLGGANPALQTTDLIDLSASPLQWQSGPLMSQARIQLNATILPSGRVLVMGGSRVNDDETTASLNTDLYDPATNTFTPAGANAIPRVYHSGSLLLPDATVMLVGGNRQRGTYQQGIEIYSPAYLFKADGTGPAIRPTIGSMPTAIGYGQAFQIQTQDAASVQSVVLVRPGAQTHAFDMDQRLVRMSFTPGSDQLTVTAPPNGNIAPPGYYMLFILNAAGVPSLAKFVQLSASVNQPPTATIDSPATAVTVNPGESVAFAGTGSDSDGTIGAYSWSFPTGSPSSSTQASANVMFATPGTHTVSFQVADDDGATSQPATRSITVADFSLSATPNSRTIAPGGSASYPATVAPQDGFTGTVSFGLTGLPAGATASFSPVAVTGSGSTTLGISTNTSIQAGTYPLVMTGTSGPVTRTVNLTLVVNGDFTISVAPATATINPDGAATYSVAISSSGFSGTVLFSVSGLPKFATGKFNPTSIVNAGNTVFTVSTNKKVARGTYPLTITASSGGLVRSIPVTLVVQ
jgi:hypothetical protein